MASPPLIKAPWWQNTNIADWKSPNEQLNGVEVESSLTPQYASHPILVDSTKFGQSYYCVGLTPVGGNSAARSVFNNAVNSQWSG